MDERQSTSSNNEQPTTSRNADGSWAIRYRKVSITLRQVVAVGRVDTAETDRFLQAAASIFKLLIDLAYAPVDVSGSSTKP